MDADGEDVQFEFRCTGLMRGVAALAGIGPAVIFGLAMAMWLNTGTLSLDILLAFVAAVAGMDAVLVFGAAVFNMTLHTRVVVISTFWAPFVWHSLLVMLAALLRVDLPDGALPTGAYANHDVPATVSPTWDQQRLLLRFYTLLVLCMLDLPLFFFNANLTARTALVPVDTRAARREKSKLLAERAWMPGQVLSGIRRQ